MPTSDHVRVASVDVQQVVASDVTKSDKIRRLNELGLPRADIARALVVRYQFVRNVLEHDKLKAAGAAGAALRADRVAEGRSALAAPAAAPAPNAAGLDPVRVELAHDGHTTIPRRFTEAVGIAPGDEAVLCVEGDELRLYSRETALRRVQRLVSRYVPADVSLADDLIAERRRQAARETDEA